MGVEGDTHSILLHKVQVPAAPIYVETAIDVDSGELVYIALGSNELPPCPSTWEAGLVAEVARLKALATPQPELLLAFLDSFENGRAVLPSWQPGTDPCSGSWRGVECYEWMEGTKPVQNL